MLSNGNNYIEPNATRLRAVDGGYFYRGKVDTDPTITANQIPIYYKDESGTEQQVEQPVYLNKAGVPVLKNGNAFEPISSYVFSFSLFDKTGQLIEYNASTGDSASMAEVIESQDQMMGYTFKGSYLPDPVTLTNEGDYALDENGVRWFGVNVPYTTDPATYPNPSNDTNLSSKIDYKIKNPHELIIPTGNTGTQNLALINELQSKYSNIFYQGDDFDIDGELFVTSRLDLGGVEVKQTNLTANSFTLNGGYLFNTTIFSNKSTGDALSIKGMPNYFVGRDLLKLVDNVRCVGDKVNNPSSTYAGRGFSIISDSFENPVSGIEANVAVEGYNIGHYEQTTGEGYINSNKITVNVNRCLRESVIESAIDKNQYTIQTNHYRINAQPRTDCEYIASWACANCTFVGTAWDVAGIADPSKAIRLPDEISPLGFYVNRGNAIDMLGVTVDRIFGAIDTNTIRSNNNKSNIKRPFANNEFGSRAYWRKTKVGANGDTDSFSYLQAVDSYIAKADKRFNVIVSETNAAGSAIGSLSPAAGSVENMFAANELGAVYETTNNVQVTISFKEGDYPETGIATDFIGIKTLGTTPIRNIYAQVRYAGDADWTDVTEDFDISNSYFITRLEGAGGLNTVGTKSIDGMRFRFSMYGESIAVENIFLMSPSAIGREYLTHDNPMVTDGNLILLNSGVGILFKSPDGSVYKMVMKNGGSPDYELQS